MCILDVHQRNLNLDCRDVCKIVFASAKNVYEKNIQGKALVGY